MTERTFSKFSGLVQRARSVWQNPVVEFFSMHRGLKAVREQASGPAAAGLAKYQLACSILRDAHQLGTSRAGHESALILYRSAVRLLISAELLRRRVESDAPQREPWERARELGIVPESPSLPRALSAEQGEAYLAELAPAERTRMLHELRAVAEQLADGSFDEATRVDRLLWIRRFRIASAALLVLAGLAWSFRGLLSPRNLALHRPVVVSDREPTNGVDPSQVVDGNELNLGFHTGNQPTATVTIDLGEVMPVRRVAVYNRIDCCQERAVPLLLQLSSDGREFATVEERKYRFQQWKVTLPPNSRARFVRLVHEAPGFFHLAEIKVF